MKMNIVLATAVMLAAHASYAGDRGIDMSAGPDPVSPGQIVLLTCTGTGEWEDSLEKQRLQLKIRQSTGLLNRPG